MSAVVVAAQSDRVNWGDGSNSADTVTLTGNGIYSVIGSHTYGEEGPFTLAIAVNDSGGHSAAAGGTATVSDATLAVRKSTVAVKGKGATLQATFMDADPNGTVSDYSATINWGDGTTPSAGTIGTNSGGNRFTVTGTHTYTKRGTFSATMTITDGGGSHVTTPLMITV